MATPKLQRVYIVNEGISKRSSSFKTTYLPINSSNTEEAEDLYLRLSSLPADLEKLFYSINFENYYELWKTLQKYTKNDDENISRNNYLKIVDQIKTFCFQF